MTILLICMFIIAVCMYIVILGGNLDKTAEEIEMEDKEQMEYIKNNCRRKKDVK